MSEAARAAPYRVRHFACIHPETYKYFFDRGDVAPVWKRLAEAYGELRRLSGFGVMEIQGERFIFRAVAGGNPITVIRTRKCEAADVTALHRLIGYEGAD